MIDSFVLLVKAHGLPVPETEVVFAPPRRWRADYLWREPRKVIVEREGGLWSKGRAGRAHGMPSSILRDMERSNAAQLAGFLYFRYTPQQLDSGDAVIEIAKVLKGRHE